MALQATCCGCPVAPALMRWSALQAVNPPRQPWYAFTVCCGAQPEAVLYHQRSKCVVGS